MRIGQQVRDEDGGKVRGRTTNWSRVHDVLWKGGRLESEQKLQGSFLHAALEHDVIEASAGMSSGTRSCQAGQCIGLPVK